MFLAEHCCKFFGGVVEIIHFAAGGNFQRGIWIFLYERRQFFRLSFSLDALRGHAYHIGDCEHELNVVRRKLPLVRRVRGENTERLIARRNRDGYSARHAKFSEQS